MDLIERQDAIDAIKKCRNESDMPDMWYDGMSCALRCIYQLSSSQPKSYREGYQAGFKDAQPECAKDFVMLKVIDLNGRPYYSIIYLEDGREYEGYSSYDLKVISEYLKRYFGFAQPEIIRCKDCKHNPKITWFGCPLAHCSETQRPETAWCWKAERREE